MAGGERRNTALALGGPLTRPTSADDHPPAEPRVSSDEPLVLGQGEAVYRSARCPSCEASEATLRTLRLDIPYFGEVFETVFLCGRCGFRHADTLLPRVQPPCEFSLRVENDGDLFVRAVKSSSATVEVPDLGLLWEPGPASNAEVTNVEGLLRRFEDAVRRAMALFETDATAAKGRELLGALEQVIGGRRSVTLTIKDPYGNSALIDPRGKASRRELAPSEAASLLTGEYIFQIGGGQPSGVQKAPPRE